MAYSIGDVIAERTVHLTRESLVRYAGASGDFNPIHYRDDVAASVGLPGVLAHGMLTMGIASSVVVAALDPQTRILDYGVRFTKPVVVDPEHGADVNVLATIGAVDEASARVDLKVTFGEATVLVKAQLRIAV
ncbi:MaoC/PaaZ C-terminal domain-containing protein [Microbacterium galbinum]|uniref:MaoC family dehydratase N-terminal domain-containing protein n=1 Tax=Microbacterium galbinum TaxID=2851646 RepID=A0ABY4ILF8_9MICO|nr:MaoC/PaaZ C-terminal domain-containing protein [Microbacterium galbinum]MCK2030878.1 MaoC family dehydratase N-terminal domain-containing protein [Microbacterium galbinum]UPL13439.1 MaoC family dehydratase N-terminal domain-containing protein [Microbacterium galbinum]